MSQLFKLRRRHRHYRSKTRKSFNIFKYLLKLDTPQYFIETIKETYFGQANARFRCKRVLCRRYIIILYMRLTLTYVSSFYFLFCIHFTLFEYINNNFLCVVQYVHWQCKILKESMVIIKLPLFCRHHHHQNIGMSNIENMLPFYDRYNMRYCHIL